MRRINRYAVVAAGSVAVALTIYLLAALPGMLSDQDSTAPVQQTNEVRRSAQNPGWGVEARY